jgi:hypothetical protein
MRLLILKVFCVYMYLIDSTYLPYGHAVSFLAALLNDRGALIDVRKFTGKGKGPERYIGWPVFLNRFTFDCPARFGLDIDVKEGYVFDFFVHGVFVDQPTDFERQCGEEGGLSLGFRREGEGLC